VNVQVVDLIDGDVLGNNEVGVGVAPVSLRRSVA
jgi:hypothetical protein